MPLKADCVGVNVDFVFVSILNFRIDLQQRKIGTRHIAPHEHAKARQVQPARSHAREYDIAPIGSTPRHTFPFRPPPSPQKRKLYQVAAGLVAGLIESSGAACSAGFAAKPIFPARFRSIAAITHSLTSLS